MKNNEKIQHREPKIQVSKRGEIEWYKSWGIRAIAIILALILCALVIVLLTGYNPIKFYASMIKGTFGSTRKIWNALQKLSMLLCISLAVTPAFKMKFWNIGAEGQIIMGAIFASYFALFHDDLPHLVLMLLMLIAGMVGGGLWGLIPAFFKSRFGTNETLFTLMLNYIALYLIKYLTEGPWRDPASSGFPKIATFVPNAQLDKVFGIHAGWVIALILVVFVFVYLRYTKQGYEITVVGESENTARYAGMNVSKIVMRTMFFSGAICGIAGMTQAAGAAYTLSEGVAGGVGFTAIIVAWLARLNPFYSVIFTLFLSVLQKGSSVMQSAFGLSTYVSDVLQGIILFVILGVDFFTQYKLIFRGARKHD